MTNDIRDLFRFDGQAARPDHPDFWKFSQIVLDLDAAMAERSPSEGVDDVIARKAAEVGDSYSLVYMAIQRAMRIHGVATLGDLVKHQEAVMHTSLAYMEGIVVGARFERLQEEPA
jgi:hypothetical protein